MKAVIYKTTKEGQVEAGSIEVGPDGKVKADGVGQAFAGGLALANGGVKKPTDEGFFEALERRLSGGYLRAKVIR